MDAASGPGVPLRLRDLAAVPALRRVLVEHAGRGFRVQLILRAALVVYAALSILLIPPAVDRRVCWLIVLAYAAWAVTAFVLARSGGTRMLQLSWLTLYGDVVALGALTVVSSISVHRTGTSAALLAGMYVLPLLAALQLRVWAAVSAIAPVVVVFAVCSSRVGSAAGEPAVLAPLWTLVLVCIGAGCVLFVSVQASRVLALGREAMRRSTLLDELLDTEARERATLSEHLHDGALQYVLAARQDLEELPADVDPALAERLQTALRSASTLLRSQVAELNPAVLRQAGLAPALQRLADEAGARGGFAVQVDVSGWRPADPAAERLLHDSAREFLSNAARHAHATTVEVVLERDDLRATLSVTDDGTGADPAVFAAQLGAGHVGLVTRRIRLEAAGGSLEIGPRAPHGLRLRAVVPLAA
jgi:two-component system NarL family sensor kinase